MARRPTRIPATAPASGIRRRAAVTCKSPYRHSWDTPGPNPNRRGGRRRSFGHLITFRCIHCGSYRYWVLSRLTGQLLASWYEPSDEYRQILDLKLSANEWRAAWMDEIDNALIEDLGGEQQ